MRLRKPFLILLMVGIAGALSAKARAVRIPLPDEIAAQADVICNWLVLSITQDNSSTDPSPSWHRVFSCRAKIKVLHVFKGTVPTAIELQYNLDEGTPNGPINIQLAAHERFRFFLRTGSSPGHYVGALEGRMDDGFAVERLADGEPDDHPYTSKADAIARAQAYLKENHPGMNVDFSSPEEQRAHRIEFIKQHIGDRKPPEAYPAFWRYWAGTWTLELGGHATFSLVLRPDGTVMEQRP